MEDFNLTYSDPLIFFLMGIPGLEASHIWISIPFAMGYIVILLGNFMVLFIVKQEQTLHTPMYLLLCVLAITDMISSTIVVPKALCIFWFKLKGITMSGCFTQIFFLNAVLVMQSAVLVLMAFDRYVAICNPLRYTTILTKARLIKLGLVGLTRAIVLILPMPLILNRLPFCDNRIIPQSYCESIVVSKLSCGDIIVSRVYSMVLMILNMGLDQSLIALSYGFIVRAVLRISSKRAYQKALNTCTAHFCVMLLYCAPSLLTHLAQQFSQDFAPHVHVILANVYLLVPSMLNPIIYGVKTKELRDKMFQYLCTK